MNKMRTWMWLAENLYAKDGIALIGSHPLYRGMDAGGTSSVVVNTTSAIDKKHVALDTESFDLFNAFLQQRFGLTLKTSHHFTGNRYDASFYGQVYRCYPHDGFRFAWSPSVVDHCNLLDPFKIAATRHLLGDKAKNMTDQAIEHQSEIWNDMGELEMKGFHHLAMKLFLERYGDSYTNGNLQAAILSGNEIILSGIYTAELVDNGDEWAADRSK